MKSLFINIQFSFEPKNIPPIGSKSRLIFEELFQGVKRKELRKIIENYHGAPLEDLEGEKFGHWLIDRYKDAQGDSCLKFNFRHLANNRKLDLEARRVRRKERAEFSLKIAQAEKSRIPKALLELNEAQVNYLLSLGDAANEPRNESNKPPMD